MFVFLVSLSGADPSNKDASPANKKTKKPSTPTTESEFSKVCASSFPKKERRGISEPFPLPPPAAAAPGALYSMRNKKENIVLT